LIVQRAWSIMELRHFLELCRLTIHAIVLFGTSRCITLMVIKIHSQVIGAAKEHLPAHTHTHTCLLYARAEPSFRNAISSLYSSPTGCWTIQPEQSSKRRGHLRAHAPFQSSQRPHTPRDWKHKNRSPSIQLIWNLIVLREGSTWVRIFENRMLKEETIRTRRGGGIWRLEETVQQGCKIWGFHYGDYEKCRLLGYNNPVRTQRHITSPLQSRAG
jgi:hypothetical protein